MKILITGGAGYIGSFVTKKFSLDEVNFVTCVDNLFLNKILKIYLVKLKILMQT